MAGEREPSQLPIASLIAVVLALGGFWLYQSPLKSSRPDHESTRHVDRSQEWVLARLWEDPFAVIDQHLIRVAHLPNEKARKDLEGRHQLRRGYFGTDNATVLLVMLDSAPYAEDIEQRLRTRYTIGMALNSAGLTPVNNQGIGYFDFKGMIVPYEIYLDVKKNGGRRAYEPVLILWVRDSSLKGVSNVMGGVRSALKKPDFKLLGPRNSTTLMEMDYQAACGADLANEDWRALAGLEIYSYRATADAGVIRYVSDSLADRDMHCKSINGLSTPEEVLRHRNIKLVRMVGSDASLANELLDELERRGVEGLAKNPQYDPKDCKSTDKIAIISEADTFYGRVLPVTFAVSLFVKTGGAPNFKTTLQRIEDDPGSWPCSLVTYTYLNGLDGEVPVGETKKKSDVTDHTAERPEQAAKHKRAAQERPEGPSQLDYAKRLAAKISDDNNANFQEGRRTFRAIGVLGSDVYDKLLLLQALRKRLPNAIFFTTDLDARLLHEDELPWTRNLLIASHYDLRLSEPWNKEVQIQVAPFRDGYQTALYLSTLQAVGWLQDEKSNSCLMLRDTKKTFSRDAAPKLYEVGRRGAVDISVTTKLECKTADVLSVSPDRPSIAPQSMTIRQHRFGFFTVVVTVTLVFGLLLLLMVRPLWAAADAVVSWLMKNWFIGVIGVSVLAAIGVLLGWLRTWLVSDGNAAEPFSAFDSVSIWPTEVLHLIGVALTLGFFAKGARDLATNRAVLEETFLSNGDTSQFQPTRSFWTRMWDWLKTWALTERWINTRPTESRERSVDATTIWSNYLGSGHISYAAPRIALIFAAYFVFVFLLFNQFETPLRPCRGTVSCNVDLCLLWLSALSSVLLSVWVFDVVRRCVALIEHVTAQPTQWPSDVLNRYLSERNVPKAFLPDWLDIQFIGERTRVVGGMVVYPFIVFVVVLTARNRYFDNWDFPLPLIIVLSLNALLIVGTAILLKRSAERARTIAMENMNELLIAQKGCEANSSRAAQLELLIEEVKNMRRGAFSNIFQQPAVTASLLGALALLQYFLPV